MLSTLLYRLQHVQPMIVSPFTLGSLLKLRTRYRPSMLMLHVQRSPQTIVSSAQAVLPRLMVLRRNQRRLVKLTRHGSSHQSLQYPLLPPTWPKPHRIELTATLASVAPMTK